MIRLDELEAWCATVAAKLKNPTYDDKRLALDALDVHVKLYPASHTPRWEIDASMPLNRVPATDQSERYCAKNLKTCFQPSTACS